MLVAECSVGLKPEQTVEGLLVVVGQALVQTTVQPVLNYQHSAIIIINLHNDLFQLHNKIHKLRILLVLISFESLQTLFS